MLLVVIKLGLACQAFLMTSLPPKGPNLFIHRPYDMPSATRRSPSQLHLLAFVGRTWYELV